MPIARVPSQSVSDSHISGTDLELVYPATATLGNLMVWCATWTHDAFSGPNPATASLPGFQSAVISRRASPGTNDMDAVEIFWRISDGTETADTLTLSIAKKLACYYTEYSGLDPDALDVVAFNVDISELATSISTGTTAALAAAESLAVGLVGVGDDLIGGMSWTNAFIPPLPPIDVGGAGADMTAALADLITASTAGQETTASWTNGNECLAAIAVFSAPGAAGDTLELEDLSHTHTLAGVTLTDAEVLAPEGLSHTHTLQDVILTAAGTLAAVSMEHGHTIQDVTFTTAGAIVVEGLEHGHNVGAVVLSEAAALAPDNLSHSHFIQNAGLTSAPTLGVANLFHPHQLEAVVLTAAQTIAAQNLAHQHFLGVASIFDPSMQVFAADDKTISVKAPIREIVIETERSL